MKKNITVVIIAAVVVAALVGVMIFVLNIPDTEDSGISSDTLDILLYDDLVYADERLILPHPEMEKRRFVLEPLVEIAPWLRHPVSGRMLKDLLTE